MQTPCPNPLSATWQRNYLFSWSWMNFPKRLLLLFLSVHAFPAGHTSGYMLPLGQSPHGPRWLPGCWGPVSTLQSSKGPFLVSVPQATGLRKGRSGFSKCDLELRRTPAPWSLCLSSREAVAEGRRLHWKEAKGPRRRLGSQGSERYTHPLTSRGSPCSSPWKVASHRGNGTEALCRRH